MFFIGILGVEHKESEIKILENFNCNNCSNLVNCRLVKTYYYFHFFFIPLFKFHVEYYIICDSCNSVYSIPKEKGKEIEHGNDVKITTLDLTEIQSPNNYIQRCTSCGRDIEAQFDYCPYCGKRIKPY